MAGTSQSRGLPGGLPTPPAELRVVVDLTDEPPAPSPLPLLSARPHLIRPPGTPVPNAPQPPPSPPVAPRDEKRFAPGETIPVGIQRMVVGLMDRSIDAIRRPGGPSDDDVHTARKSMRRARGLLRLVRDALGPAYRAENDTLRDTARLLSDVRSSAVAGSALADLLDQFGTLLVDGVYRDLAERLHHRHRTIAGQTLDNRLLLAGVATNLERVRARVAAFPTSPANDFGYHGPLIPNDSEILVKGLARTYGRGQRAMKLAAGRPFPEHLHEWRKRVRYLRFQMEALYPAWPEVMRGVCSSLDSLSESLGRERDLWELAETVRREPDLCSSPVAQELLSALTLEVRQSLREQCFRLGTRMYVESPDAFAHRIQTYWDAWMSPAVPAQ